MKREKAESILNTARQMFRKYGIQKTNLEDIARHSKVAKATIYNYFGNKDRVYLEVLNREIGLYTELISKAIEQEISPKDKLRAFLHTSFKFAREKAEILNLQSDTMSRYVPDAKKIRKDLFTKQASLLESILKDGFKNGIFSRCDVSAARGILYAIIGFEHTWLLDPDKADPEADLDGLLNILCNGIILKE
jgi:AcrR family transcriptional regulator